MKRLSCAVIAAILVLLSVTVYVPAMAQEQTNITSTSPCIPADAGTEIDLSDYSVDGKTDIVWKDADGNTIDTFTPDAKGVYPLTAEMGTASKTIYVIAKNADESEYVLYEADFSKYTSTDELKAEGYRLVSDATYTFEDDALVIGNSPNDCMVLVLPSWIGDFGNYSITTEAKTVSEMDAGYWFGIAYRIQSRGRSLYPFYQMSILENFNPINDIQFHEMTSSTLWNYAMTSGSGLITLKDSYHTYNVTAYDNVIKYSMDGEEIIYATEPFVGRTVRYYGKGLVAITLNDIGSVAVKNIKITLQTSEPEKAELAAELMNNSRDELNLVNPIANVQSVAGEDAANLLDGADAPGSIAVALSEVENIADLLNKCTEKAVIPTFFVDTTDEAAALTAALEETGFKDANAVSGNPAVLAAIREKAPYVRTGLRVTIPEGIFDSKAADAIRSDVRSAPATFCVIGCDDAAKDAVTELQELAIAVWVEVYSDPADSSFTADALRAVTSGANGIITKDHAALAAAVNGNLAEGTLTRTPTVVGHRGNPTVAPENTVSGFITAYENGADAFELDIVISEDGEVMVLHDGDLTRTTNYEGKEGVGEMTLAEIREYRVYGVDGELTDETVPTLREVFEAFKDRDCRILIEFKDENAAIITAVADIIKEYGMEDRVNVISFSTKVLTAAKDALEGISAGYLFNMGTPDTVEELLDRLYLYVSCTQMYESSMCPSSGFIGTGYTRATTDRGMPVWSWTYTNEDNNDAFFSGTDGMTTDDVQWATDMVKSIRTSIADVKLAKGESADIAISAETYGDAVSNVPFANLTVKLVDGDGIVEVTDGKITALADGTAHVMYGYTVKTADGTDYTLYTQPVAVTVGSDLPILWIAIAAGAVVAVAVVAVVAVKMKKK